MAKTDAVKGCSLKEGRYCPAMDRLLQSNTRAKGLVVFNMRTASQDFRITKRMIVYVAATVGTKKDKQPVVLNVCPWCTSELGVIDL